MKNGGTVTAAPDGTMTVPGIVPLRAVSAEAPASPQDGEKYGNTTDGKIYKAASGSWAEAAGDDAAAAGILYAAGGRFWRWDTENGFALI